MMKNEYKAEIEDFKKILKEYNISLRDYVEIYHEWAELQPNVKATILSLYI